MLHNALVPEKTIQSCKELGLTYYVVQEEQKAELVLDGCFEPKHLGHRRPVNLFQFIIY